MVRALLLTFAAVLFGTGPAPALAASSIDGKWSVTWDTEGGIRRNVWTVTTDGDAVTVEVAKHQLKGTFKDGQLAVEGDFHSAEAGYSSKLKVTGELADGELKGRGTWDQYAMTFVAQRAD